MQVNGSRSAEVSGGWDRLVDTTGGSISRRLFFDQDIFDAELEAVFTRAWLFIGHESQIPNPGDFFVSRMGTESVILSRDKDGEIHVFLNSCRHRGMKVCRYDEGNTNVFTCPYHAWKYTGDGKLSGVPMRTELYPDLDVDEWSLISVAKMEIYKGTVWATWDPDAPSLRDYLGEAITHLDLALDHRDGSPGGSEVFGGVHKWIVPCNWKFPSENFAGDTYHSVSHESADLIGIGPSGRGEQKGRRDPELDKAQHLWITFPGGHGIHSALKAHTRYEGLYRDDPIVDDYFRRCHESRLARLGDERAKLVPFVGTIFPNTSYHGGQPRSLVVWHPHGPQHAEIWRFFLVDADAPPEVKHALRRFYMRYSGPAGMTEQDDMENWNYATKASAGPIAQRYPFNYQQSMGRSTHDGPVPGLVSTQVTEENSRGYYDTWVSYMEGRTWPEILTTRNGG